MRPFLSVLVLAGCLLPGSIGATYCTVDDDTPVFSAPDLGSRVVTRVERNTCFHGDMEGEWLVLQDKPIYYIHGYTVNEDTESGADINGYQEYDPWYKQSVRSRCVDVEGINTCAGARSIPNNKQEKRFLMGVCQDGADNCADFKEIVCPNPALNTKCAKTCGLCSGDALWTNWIEWSECDTTQCNIEGTRNRTRVCFVLNPNVHANCNGGDWIQSQKCTKPCLGPCSGGFAWTLWHACPKSCDGTTTRMGYCMNGTAKITTTEEKNCTRYLCPVDGTWSEWGKWGSCSTTVNLAPGIRYRHRRCLPRLRNGGADCPGKPFEIGACMESEGQWVSGVLNFSSQYDTGSWSAQQILGVQNVYPSYGDLVGTWAPRDIDANQFLEFQFATPVYVTKVDVYETYNAGGVKAIKCLDVSGTWITLWSTPQVSRIQYARIFSPSFTSTIHCFSNRIRLDIDCTLANTYVEIDAVLLHGSQDHGSWGAWEGWSVCYCSGFRLRYRKCDSPPPLNGGQYCNGNDFEVSTCNRISHTNCPVDGNWADWSVWSTCSVSCENGTQSRNRSCINQAYGGKDCGSDDSASRNCSTSIPCPVAGRWSTWSNWSICSATCQATGTQYRNRSCDNPPPDNGGQNCTGVEGYIRNCNGIGPCPVNGGYSNWLQWSDCSATCEGGVRYRSRECNHPRPQNGGSNCSVLGKSNEPMVCNIQPCPVDGYWGLWSHWSRCDVTCGNATRTRDRLCVGTAYGGENCSGNALQTGACNKVVCPVDGAWGQWADWSVCNCNSTQTRVRKCDSPAPVGSGQQCPGSTRDTVSCSDIPATCPVDGQWGSWYPWGACSTTCGPGEMSRLRLCNNPRPQNRGLFCDINPKGEADRMECHGPPCPIDGSWTDWTSWSACSVTCGNGSQSRNRSCEHPAPAYGGVNCAGSDNENGSCTQKHCPIDGNWSGWSTWFACDVTCATGTRHRVRTCDSPAPKYGGQPCIETADQFEQCQEPPCPIDGMWGSWKSWTSCSVTCLNGTRSRTRLCDSPVPQHGGSYCTGQENVTATCVPRDNCDVDGGWSEWIVWSPCDVSCNTGHHTRYRLCDHPQPENLGKFCEGPDTEVGECFDYPCPIDGGFDAWMAWGSCFPSTGNGLKTRSRLCNKPQPKNGGRNCQGNYTEQLQCCDSDCPVDGDWSDWSTWSDCPADSFVNTTKSRTRTCSMPSPQFFGANCTGVSVETDCCPVNGGFGAWTVWSLCTGNCADAHKERVRQCNNPRPSCGGRYCGSGREDHTCIPDHCTTTTTIITVTPSAGSPAIIASNMTEAMTQTTTTASTSGLIPAVTSAAFVTTTTATVIPTEISTSTTQVTAAWSAWFNGLCSVTCGSGTLTRMRHCSTDHTEDCVGNSREVIDCQKTPCKVNGSWSSWSTWSQCDVTCEDGHIQRTRMCTNPAPAFGGLNCSGQSLETNACTLAKCPSWSEWFLGDCSVTCGDGTLSRMRMCSSGHDEDCPGSAFDTVSCSQGPC